MMWHERYSWRARALWNPKDLFGGGSPPPSVTAPPPTMPDPLAPDVLAARRKALLDAQQNGRSSTMLTTPLAAGSPMGAGGSKLGG